MTRTRPQSAFNIRPTPSTPLSSAVGFHFGSVLGIVANQYRSLMEAILEAIQNGLDARAGKINVNINQKTRNVHIQDNGVGASRDHMEKCLREIARSQKDRGKLGQFGIGVVASFGKCRRFTFTSKTKARSSPMYRWVFDCDVLAGSADETTVPCAPVAAHEQWWNSELFIENYTSNHLKSTIDFDQFCTAIYDRYGAAMLRHKTTIQVKLTLPNGEQEQASLPPMDFTGQPLPLQTFDGELCGKTTIRMFVVKPGSTKGRKRRGQNVRVMDSTGYTLPFSEKLFAGPDGVSLVSAESARVLTSGHFEGEIIFGDEVRLDPTRRFFSETMATLEAVSHIEAWIEEHGRNLVERIEDEATSARYRRLGDQSLRVIDHFLRERTELAKLLRSFNWGHQGKQHAPNDAKKDGQIQGKAIQGGGPKKPTDPGKTREPKEPSEEKEPREPRERPNHRPMAVGGDGNIRTFSRHASTGLLLVYEAGGKDLWSLDKDKGMITINIVHPTWVAHDRLDGSLQSVRDQLICQLQEKIIIHTLMCLKLADDLGADIEPILTLYAHEFVDSEHFLTTRADKIAQRGRYRPKKNSKNPTEEVVK